MPSNTYKRSKIEIDEAINNLHSKHNGVDGFLSLIKLVNLLLDLDDFDLFIDVAGRDIKTALSHYFPHCKELNADDFKVIRLLLKDPCFKEYFKRNKLFIYSSSIIGTGSLLTFKLIPNPWFKIAGLCLLSTLSFSLLRALYITLVQFNYKRKVSIRKTARKKRKEAATGKHYYDGRSAEPCFS